MGRDASLSINGVVLSVTGYGESDKLVTLYTQDFGRITAIAKGALKSKKRFVNKLEPYSILRVLYQPPRVEGGLYLLREAELLEAHIPLRTEFQRYAAASHFVELVLLFTRENDPDFDLFRLLCWALRSLSLSAFPLQSLTYAQLHLLGILGYRPDLRVCGRCHQPVSPPHTYQLLPGYGALLCDTCQPDARQISRLSVQTIRALAGVQSMPLDRLDRLHLPQGNILEALRALHTYTLHLLQQDIPSWHVLRVLYSGTFAGSPVGPATSLPRGSGSNLI